MNINDLPKTVDKEIEFEGFPSGDMDIMEVNKLKLKYVGNRYENPELLDDN